MRHKVTTMPVEKLRDGIIGYQWKCSCGREGFGFHRTPEKAIQAGQAHIPAKSIVKEHGGWASFLDWCEETKTSFQDLDITDDEWANLHRKNRDFTKPCIAYLGNDECSWCIDPPDVSLFSSEDLYIIRNSLIAYEKMLVMMAGDLQVDELLSRQVIHLRMKIAAIRRLEQEMINESQG